MYAENSYNTSSSPFASYFIPGQRHSVYPTPFSVSRNHKLFAQNQQKLAAGQFAQMIDTDVALLFIEQRNCSSVGAVLGGGTSSGATTASTAPTSHNISLSYRLTDGSLFPVTEIVVPAGSNVVHVDSFLRGWSMYSWSIVSNCEESSGSSSSSTAAKSVNGTDFEGGVGPMTLLGANVYSNLYYATTTTTTTVYPISIADLYNTNPNGAPTSSSTTGTKGGATAGTTSPLVPASAYVVESSVTISFGSAAADSAFWNACGTTSKLNDASIPLCAAFITALKASVCNTVNQMLPEGKKVECIYIFYVKIALQVVDATTGLTSALPRRLKIEVSMNIGEDLSPSLAAGAAHIENKNVGRSSGATSTAGAVRLRRRLIDAAPVLAQQDMINIVDKNPKKMSALQYTGMVSSSTSSLARADEEIVTRSAVKNHLLRSSTSAPEDGALLEDTTTRSLVPEDHNESVTMISPTRRSLTAAVSINSGNVQVLVEYEIRFPDPAEALTPEKANEIYTLLQAAAAAAAASGTTAGGGSIAGGGTTSTTSTAAGGSTSSGTSGATASTSTTSSGGAGATTASTTGVPSFASLLATALTSAIAAAPELQTAKLTSPGSSISVEKGPDAVKNFTVWIPEAIFDSVPNATRVDVPTVASTAAAGDGNSSPVDVILGVVFAVLFLVVFGVWAYPEKNREKVRKFAQTVRNRISGRVNDDLMSGAGKEDEEAAPGDGMLEMANAGDGQPELQVEGQQHGEGEQGADPDAIKLDVGQEEEADSDALQLNKYDSALAAIPKAGKPLQMRKKKAGGGGPVLPPSADIILDSVAVEEQAGTGVAEKSGEAQAATEVEDNRTKPGTAASGSSLLTPPPQQESGSALEPPSPRSLRKPKAGAK
ncbi:unnamed protein product [Amoebophrya sp. A120]|nr:unnamed protein product [Amoebophrya sp. A120]|eukprot:GSA120T00022038001.1